MTRVNKFRRAKDVPAVRVQNIARQPRRFAAANPKATPTVRALVGKSRKSGKR